MTDDLSDIELEALLQEAPYIDDAGFTATVLAKVPRRRPWRRPLILGGTAAVGVVLAVWVSPISLVDFAMWPLNMGRLFAHWSLAISVAITAGAVGWAALEAVRVNE